MKNILIALSVILLISIVTSQDCGEGVGKCSSGACCSKWGYCGISDDHCLVSRGCQSAYGSCKGEGGSNVDETINTKKKEEKKGKNKKKKKDDEKKKKDDKKKKKEEEKKRKEEEKRRQKEEEKKKQKQDDNKGSSSGEGLTEKDATENEKIVWNLLLKEGLTKEGAAGVMGNLMVESYIESTVYEESLKPTIGLTDEEYVRKTNDGTYTNFVNDNAGFGLCQWTWDVRKQNLLNKCRGKIGDMSCQLEFLLDELRNTLTYPTCLAFLKTSRSVKDSCLKFMKEFENPAFPNEGRRIALAQIFYEMFTGTGEKGHFYRIKKGDSLYDVSLKYGTTLQTIYDLNPGISPNIYVGQKIRVP